jgi:hypothetical protein
MLIEIFVSLLETLVVHGLGESGMLADEFNRISVALSFVGGFLGLGKRGEPLVLLVPIVVLGAAFDLLIVLNFVVALVEDGQPGFCS